MKAIDIILSAIAKQKASYGHKVVLSKYEFSNAISEIERAVYEVEKKLTPPKPKKEEN